MSWISLSFPTHPLLQCCFEISWFWHGFAQCKPMRIWVFYLWGVGGMGRGCFFSLFSFVLFAFVLLLSFLLCVCLVVFLGSFYFPYLTDVLVYQKSLIIRFLTLLMLWICDLCLVKPEFWHQFVGLYFF